jgi:hypothetical protein
MHAQSFIKYGYFSVSIVLIEFMATYVKTNVGFLKNDSALNLINNNLVVYIILFLTALAGINYVI